MTTVLRPMIAKNDNVDINIRLSSGMSKSNSIRDDSRNIPSVDKKNENMIQNLHINTSETLIQQSTPSRRMRSISPHARAFLRRTFSRSRSRSRTTEEDGYDDDASSVSSSSSSSSSSTSRSSKSNRAKQMLVAVTSCRSDAYYAQKAPGAISMLPRKAPSALKLFHELAVGMKDAYEAVGRTPTRPDNVADTWKNMDQIEKDGRMILVKFMGNINFVSLCHILNIFC